MNIEVTWLELAKEYEKMQSKRKKYELEEKKIKELMIKMQCGKPYTEDRYEMKIIMRKGLVQYDKIPQLKNVDLDHYRSEEVMAWTFKVLY